MSKDAQKRDIRYYEDHIPVGIQTKFIHHDGYGCVLVFQADQKHCRNRSEPMFGWFTEFQVSQLSCLEPLFHPFRSVDTPDSVDHHGCSHLQVDDCIPNDKQKECLRNEDGTRK